MCFALACCSMPRYAALCRNWFSVFEPVICCVLLRFVALCWVVHPAVLDLIVVHVLRGSVIEGSLEVKLPTIWTDEKQSRAEQREEED